MTSMVGVVGGAPRVGTVPLCRRHPAPVHPSQDCGGKEEDTVHDYKGLEVEKSG
jgi:hypothetical protein